MSGLRRDFWAKDSISAISRLLRADTIGYQGGDGQTARCGRAAKFRIYRLMPCFAVTKRGCYNPSQSLRLP
jgi:hypothetical protein